VEVRGGEREAAKGSRKEKKIAISQFLAVIYLDLILRGFFSGGLVATPPGGYACKRRTSFLY
jgi:hypothetical protein